MRVTKCDLCKKEIDSNLVTIIIGNYFSRVELCEECGEPVIDFLREEGLQKEEQSEF